MATTRFTVNEIATLAHLVGRNAESLLLSGQLEPDVQEVVFKAMSTVDVAVTPEHGYITAIPGGTVGVSPNQNGR
jgi:hypothetical protein